MLNNLFAIFLILHGLVHLLYLGQSAGYFELQPGLAWPNGSWAFAQLLGNSLTRKLTAGSLALIAAIFAAGGVTLLMKRNWWRPLIIAAAALSALLYILLWDGRVQRLDDKGGVGLLLNLAILSALLFLPWPSVDF